MSASLNETNLIGRPGSDPEMRYTPQGQAVTWFSLATDRSWKAADGTKKEATDWHNIEVWGKLAEIVNQYVKKGRLLFVKGSLRYDQWEKDGQKHYRTKIIASTVQMLDKAPANGNAAPEAEPEAEQTIDFSA